MIIIFNTNCDFSVQFYNEKNVARSLFVLDHLVLRSIDLWLGCGYISKTTAYLIPLMKEDGQFRTLNLGSTKLRTLLYIINYISWYFQFINFGRTLMNNFDFRLQIVQCSYIVQHETDCLEFLVEFGSFKKYRVQTILIYLI